MVGSSYRKTMPMEFQNLARKTISNEGVHVQQWECLMVSKMLNPHMSLYLDTCLFLLSNQYSEASCNFIYIYVWIIVFQLLTINIANSIFLMMLSNLVMLKSSYLCLVIFRGDFIMCSSVPQSTSIPSLIDSQERFRICTH